MNFTKLTAKAVFAIECVPDDTKRFVREVNLTRDQLREQRLAKLAILDAQQPLPPTKD